MKKEELIIGILGGMGTYATINLFRQYAEVFSAEKEWERPRIIIDNRCTMPSRVRAFLYQENVDLLVNEMAESLYNLMQLGCNRIILACNTSHLFLPMIYQKHPELKTCIVNIIDKCVTRIVNDKINEVYLLGSEGTIDSKIYQNALSEKGVDCIVPKTEEYSMLRKCIEAVKQNKYSDDIKHTFIGLINRYDNCILGCTELPVLYEKYRQEITCRGLIYDPLFLALEDIKEADYGTNTNIWSI